MSGSSSLTALSIAAVWAERERAIGSLSPRERAIFAALRLEKRRRDWLAGRVAAKRAAQRLLGGPLAAVEILAEAAGERSGAPRLHLEGVLQEHLHVSLSHAGDLAAATVSERPVGLDVEEITARSASFEAIAFSPAERLALGELSGQARAEAVTLRWCAKEAHAKWLGCGLRAPLHDLAPPEHLELETSTFTFGGRPFAHARVTGLRISAA